MLKLFALVRFALSHSPTREQREVWFANTDPNNPQNPPDQGETIQPLSPHPGEGSEVEQAAQESHAAIQGALERMDSQALFAELQGALEQPETFDRLLEREETLADIDITAIAERTGITRRLQEIAEQCRRAEMDRLRREGTVTNVPLIVPSVPQDPTGRAIEKLKQAYRSGLLSAAHVFRTFGMKKTTKFLEDSAKPKAAREDLKLADFMPAVRRAQIARQVQKPEFTVLPTDSPREILTKVLTADNESGIPPAEKRAFIMEVLRSSPRVTAALGSGLLNRLSELAEQERILEEVRRDLGPEGVQQAVRIAQRTQSIEGALATLRPQKRLFFLSGKLSRPRMLLLNASKALRRSEDFGARYWGAEERGSAQFEEQSRHHYLQSLREETQKLLTLLSAQVREEGAQIAQTIETAVQAVVVKVRRGERVTPEEDHILKSGGDIIERLRRRVEVPLAALEHIGQPADPGFAERAEEGLATCNGILTMLPSLHADAEALATRWSHEGPAEETKEAKDTRAWAERCRRLLAILTAGDGDASLSGDTRERLRWLMKFLMDEEALPAFSKEKRESYEYWLTRLCDFGERELQEMETRAQKIESGVQNQIDSVGLEKWLKQQSDSVNEEEQGLLGVLKHPICASLGIPDQVRGLADDLRAKIHVLGNKRIREQERRELCARIGAFLSAMHDAREKIRVLEEFGEDEAALTANGVLEVLPPAEYEARFPLRAQGCRSLACYDKGKLYLRGDVPPEKRQATIRHERGHLIIAILTEQSTLFPTLLSERAENLEPEALAVLEDCGERWGVTRERVAKAYAKQLDHLPPELKHRRIEALYRRELLEEGLVRKSLAEEDPGTLQDSDRAAFAALGGKPEEAGMVRHITEEEGFDLGEQGEQGAKGAQGEAAAEGAGIARGEEYNPDEDFDQIALWLQHIRSFGDAYPRYRPQVADILDSSNGYAPWLQFFQKIYTPPPHQETTPDGQTFDCSDPQHDPRFREGVKSFRGHVEEKHKQIIKIDAELSDANEAKPTARKGFKALSNAIGIQWLCALDIARIFNEFKEDILGMWKTDQDHKTAEAEAALAKGLPKTIFGVKIPIIGKYTERMAHYAERRKNENELTRVKKWEDAFKNLDADDLFDLIGKRPTRDQLRASMNLLVEKGRMNWGDERLWEALNMFSKYQMPIAVCRRNEILRDKWLHKLISDIWIDKNMFEDWQTKNESNYDSHKNAYTHEADNLSNLSGQMARELESMLRLFVKHTDNGQLRAGESLPEEVNPHHYEEILHYAMRNGKMRMEDKIFYLIQGIRYHLIPINRLRVLAGQKGELLTKFPFLDYFYQRHNTYPEIEALGKRLDESGSEETRFIPGPKTTLFMRLIVAKDDGVQKRIAKATSRKMEEVDHEDVPYILTDVNWAKLRNLMDVVSGGRWKVTNQGMQNTYVGFNEKFKIYAAVAEMEAEGMETFPESYIRNLAESAAAYVIFDNQVVRASSPGGNVEKGNLEWTEINHQVPVSSSGPRTSEFRNRMRDFIRRLAQDVGMSDTDLAGTGVTLQEMLASQDRDEGKIDVKNATKKKEIYEATERFAMAFQQKIVANPGALKALLREWQRSPSTAFLDSSSKSTADTNLTRESIRQNYRKIVRF